MRQLQELEQAQVPENRALLPVSVIIPTRNESRNLPRCLQSLRGVAEVYVVDSQSTDATPEIARQHGANVVQFYYYGGWPKKRQWAMDTLPLTCDWVLLLDADEVLTPDLTEEIRRAIQSERNHGYYIALDMYFLGRRLHHGDACFWKLSLFRRGRGRFECRLEDQDTSMADMEVHEHVIVDGPTGKLTNRLIHHNVNSLSDYIQKHNEYSNWEARVWNESRSADELPSTLFGTQAQRRRWLRRHFLGFPGSPLFFFFYKYCWRLGFLDGVPGLIYCCFQGIQFFHIKAKIYELRRKG
jgi:glycosyltransferase involved in cell wall biosynthesis